MPIDIYMLKYSPPCRAVLMVAKQLNIDYNIKVVDLSEGQHLEEDYLKINPTHTIPTLDDNGFILWESRAIMQYLCNQYSPDSPLYPKDPKKRALVDLWLNFDIGLFSGLREAIAKPLFGLPVTEEATKAFNDKMKLLDQLIGDKKYLVGDHLTLADLTVLATTSGLIMFGHNVDEYPNFKRWVDILPKELPYFEEVNAFPKEEIIAFAAKMKEFMSKKMQGDKF